jgi:DNA-binding NarL/FixJ family response regulator
VAAACLAVTGTAFAAHEALGYPPAFGTLGLYVALYSAGAWAPRPRPVLAAAASVACLGFALALHALGSAIHLVGYAEFYLALAAFWVAGAYVRRRRAQERERREVATVDATGAERARIAHELHDVVTHHVTAMVVQADAAQFLAAEPQRTAPSLTAIGGTGRRALAELRDLLGVLDPAGSLGRAPALGTLRELVEQTRLGGQPVKFAEDGTPPALSAAAELAGARADRAAGAGRAGRRGAGRGGRAGWRLPGPRADSAAERSVTAPRPPIRVLICEDQALVRAGYATIFGAQPDMEVVGEAADGAAAVEAALLLRPDVVVMDIRMPLLDGIEATRRLAGPGAAEPARILVVTTFSLDEYVYEALRAGASGFLLKDAPPAELVGAVRTVAAGEALLAPAVTRTLSGRFAGRVRPASGPGAAGGAQLATLSGREREILVLIAGGLSNAEIAAELVLSPETVKTYVPRILTKLDLRDRVQAVVLAYRAGLVDAAAD